MLAQCTTSIAIIRSGVNWPLGQLYGVPSQQLVTDPDRPFDACGALPVPLSFAAEVVNLSAHTAFPVKALGGCCRPINPIDWGTDEQEPPTHHSAHNLSPRRAAHNLYPKQAHRVLSFFGAPIPLFCIVYAWKTYRKTYRKQGSNAMYCT